MRSVYDYVAERSVIIKANEDLENLAVCEARYGYLAGACAALEEAEQIVLRFETRNLFTSMSIADLIRKRRRALAETEEP